MSTALNPGIRIRVDVTNPGQFFACCGLLELANRHFESATGCFLEEQGVFEINHRRPKSGKSLFEALVKCDISSTLTQAEIARLKSLLNTKKDTLSNAVRSEKAELSRKWNEEQVFFGPPFELRVSWWNRTDSGRLKTWAGKQLVTEIIAGLIGPMRKWDWEEFETVLHRSSSDGGLPFYFDAQIGSGSSSIDVGYSLDALSIRSGIRPAIELLAFVGLQRFQPRREGDKFTYRTWRKPLPPILAAAACGCGYPEEGRAYQFDILYRTKYLKAFLTAKPINP